MRSAPSACRLERILAVQSWPKTPTDALAEDQRHHQPPWLDEGPVSPRPTSDYQALLNEGARDSESTEFGAPAEPPTPRPGGETGGFPPLA